MRFRASHIAAGVTIAFAVLAGSALATTTITVPVPANIRQDLPSLVLRIDDLKLPPNASGIVRVFADLPGANAATATEDEHFLGYFTIVPKSSAEAARGVQRSSVSLDVSHKMPWLAGKNTVTLTLVPLGRAAEPTAAGRDELTFSRVYFSQD